MGIKKVIFLFFLKKASTKTKISAMGNVRSDFQFNIKAQAEMINADTNKYPIYKYITSSNEGLLIKLARRAFKTKDFTDLDYVIQNECVDFLYNQVKGENVSFTFFKKSRSRRIEDAFLHEFFSPRKKMHLLKRILKIATKKFM